MGGKIVERFTNRKEESGQENGGGAKDRTEDIDRINKLNALPIKK